MKEEKLKILNKYIDFSQDGVVDRVEILKAMQEYAELYHIHKSKEPNTPTQDNLNAIQELETNFKKEFKKVFKSLNYVISYSECVILLNTLKGVEYNPGENEYASIWQLKFIEMLK